MEVASQQHGEQFTRKPESAVWGAGAWRTDSIMECFDPDSGQVFRETIIRPQSSKNSTWQHKCLGTKPHNVLSRRGASSLTNMALRRIVCEAHVLEPETLKAVPSRILDQIWTAIKRNSSDSLHVWKIFAESGYGDKNFMHHSKEPSPQQPPSFYCSHLNSPTFAWLVNVTLIDAKWTATDFKQLALLQNLQSLYVKYTRGRAAQPFDDYTLRSLSARAEHDRAFSQLTMIFIENAEGITWNIFDCLNRFPRLEAFYVFETKIESIHKSNAKKYGWNRTLDSTFFAPASVHLLKLRYQASYCPGYSFRSMVQTFVHNSRSQSKDSLGDRPLVDVVFGVDRDTGRRPQDIHEVLSFQRDWNYNKPGSEETFVTSRSKIDQSQDGPPAGKKRRIKEGKAIALDTLLDGV